MGTAAATLDDAGGGADAPSLPAPSLAPDPLAAGRAVLFEGLCTLVTALAAALVTWGLTMKMGFVSESRRAMMLPFNLAAPVNTIFQYGACLLAVVSAGGLYAWAALPRLGRVARGLDLFASTIVLAVLWWTTSHVTAVVLLSVRALVLALLMSRSGRAIVERDEAWARTAAWAPLVGMVVLGGFLSLVLPAGLIGAVVAAPLWLLALVAAPFALFAVEERLSPRARLWERRIAAVVGLVAIPCVTFRIAAAVFDFDLIVAPANDLLLGKDILDSVVSTYGFLFTYAVALMYWAFHVTDLYIGLAVLNALAFTVGYAAIFLFLLAGFKRPSLAFGGMIVIIAVHYFHLHVPITWLPQSGFLRFGAMLPMFFLLYARDERPESRALEWLFAASSAIAMLWTIEVGGYILLGIAAALGRELLFRPGGHRRALRLLAKIAVAVGVVLAILTARIVLRHGHAPIWSDLFHFQRAYSAGLAMGRPQSIERWPIPILISLAAIFAVMKVPRLVRHPGAWLFLAVFGLAAMVYPLGKGPGLFELGRVVLPSMLLVAMLVASLNDRRADLTVGAGERRFNVATVASIAWLAVAGVSTCFVHAEIGSFLKTSAETERKGAKPIAYASPSWQAFLATPDKRAQFQRDLETIRSLVPPGEALPILSKNDTLYYVFGQRKALFKNAFHPHFFFKSDIDDMVNALLSSKVDYLFLDNTGYKTYENGIDATIANQVWGRVSPRYRHVQHAGLLEVFQRRPDAEP